VASNQPAYAPAPPGGPTGPATRPWDEPAPAAPAAPEPVPDPAPAVAAAFDAAYAIDAAYAAYAPAAPAPAPEAGPGAGPEPGAAPAGPAGATARERSDRPKLPRQRNLTRGSTVIGIAAMAAVGAGGMAVAASPAATGTGTGRAPISTPDLDFDTASGGPSAPSAPAPSSGPADPGEALRARILGQVAAQREATARAERAAAEQAAAREAAARKVREQAAAAKAAAEAKARADQEAAAKAEAERLEQLARSYVTPLASYTLTDRFGEADLWSNLHAGQDFSAPTGTPVHAVHTGTITSAGWAGSYGYRVVLTLDDGTQLWYCHLSTMVVTEGRVTTGDTIGRVGATGNVPTPHLHLEVRPGGGAPVDPLPWLASHQVNA
jgi:murein DD-endopeptidase MepM/ murein hydrolase activator NlpD